MRYAAFAIILVLAAFLFAGCTGQASPSTGASNLPDVNQYSARINSTGIVGPYELHNAYSRHVFTLWSTNTTVLYNVTTFTAVTTRVCSNTTNNASNTSLNGCANTTAVGTGNFSTYKSNTTYSMTLNTTNMSLNNSTGAFDLSVNGANLNQANASDAAYIYLYNPSISAYVNTGYSLSPNVTNWTNITAIPMTYVSSAGAISVKFEAATSNANASNPGITIDYLAVNGTYTYPFVGGSYGNVTFQTSLDNRNWFDELSVSSGTAAQRFQTNNTALYARFNVTGLTLTDPTQDAIYTQYVAVSN